MHPVLFEIPLPSCALPLAPALLLVAAVGAVVALIGWRAKAVDLVVIGLALAAGGAIGAVALRGQTYELTVLPLSSYGVMVCVALVAGWYLTFGLARRDALPRETTANCCIVAALSGLVAARLLYGATNPDEFAGWRELVDVRRGGLSAYGALLGGTLGVFAFLRARRLPWLPWGDVVVPSVALGIALGRVGSYLLGSSYGKPLMSNAPGWLRRLGTFPRWPDDVLNGTGAPAWVGQVSDGRLSFDSAASLPVHPVQLYEAAGGLVLLGTLFLIRQRQAFRGQLFLAFAFGYGCLRVGIDQLRDDPQRGLLGPHLAEHHFVTLVLLMLAAAFVFGPSRSLLRVRLRQIAQAASLLPAVIAYLVLRPEPFALAEPLQLSVSQYAGLLSAIAAAVAWGMLARVAEADPVGAMALSFESDAADEVDVEPDEGAAAPEESPEEIEDEPDETEESPDDSGNSGRAG